MGVGMAHPPQGAEVLRRPEGSKHRGLGPLLGNLPALEGPHPSPPSQLPSQRAVQMAAVPGPQGPWEGVGKLGLEDSWVPEDFGLAVSPPLGPATTGQSQDFVQT